ncbi:13931_t:CDS:1, partial [Ambispora leptoticha]
IIETLEPAQTPAGREAEARRLQVGELMESERDRYWMVENDGNTDAMKAFVASLNVSLNSFFLNL